MIENMDSMDEESFMAYFGEERTWTTVLSNGHTVPLRPDGADSVVAYEDRHEYSQLVQAVRLSETDRQVGIYACLTWPCLIWLCTFFFSIDIYQSSNKLFFIPNTLIPCLLPTQ